MNGRHRLGQTERTEVKQYVPTSVYRRETISGYFQEVNLVIILEPFSSPDRRGRGILVVPGFCQASGVTFSCGRKNFKKLVVNFF